jgi:hypothetical protein
MPSQRRESELKMPCFTVRTVTVDFRVANREVLVRGLTAAGFRVSVEGETVYAYSRTGQQLILRGGKARTVEGQEAVVNEAKRAYANEAVRTAARKFNFGVQQDARDRNHVTISRRSF